MDPRFANSSNKCCIQFRVLDGTVLYKPVAKGSAIAAVQVGKSFLQITPVAIKVSTEVGNNRPSASSLRVLVSGSIKPFAKVIYHAITVSAGHGLPFLSK